MGSGCLKCFSDNNAAVARGFDDPAMVFSSDVRIDPRARGGGKLDRKLSHATRGAIDEHFTPDKQAAFAQRV